LPTAALSLRQPRDTDAGDLRRLLLDPRIQAWLAPPPLEPLSASDVDNLLQRDIQHWRTHGFGPWLVHERGAFRARIGLRRSEVLNAVELAWAVTPESWGRGIATRTARAALELAAERSLGQVVAFTTPGNHASLRVMERLGMRRQGEIEHAGLRQVLYRTPPAARVYHSADRPRQEEPHA